RARWGGGLAIERASRGPAQAPVVPRRLRVPLVQHGDPLRSLDHGGLERESRRALQLFGQLAANRVDDVDLAPLERGQAGRFVGDDFEDETLDARGLAPVSL